MNKLRLEAEVIRDSTLAVAGTLNTKAGGPGIKPRIPEAMLADSQRNKWPIVKQEGPEHWRRSVYIYVKRQLPFPLLELFDAPNSAQTCDRRNVSTVPTQALVLMNDEFMQDQAGYFADRVRKAVGEDPAAQAREALWRAFSREPSPRRVAEATSFLGAQKALGAQKPTGAQQVLGAQGTGEKGSERQALIDLCHVLLNCNEFVYVD
jgi:hypothetical protein